MDVHQALALAAARSHRWEDRAAAAQSLAIWDDPRAHTALMALLNDDDLAVIECAAECLLALPTTSALGLFTGSYLQVGDQSGDYLNDALRTAAALNPRLRPALMERAAEGDAGARAALEWLA